MSDDKPTAPFFAACPFEWEEARCLAAGAFEWPEGFAVLDLRYHQDRALGPRGRSPNKRMVRSLWPSRNQFATEWGWTKGKVSRLLADVERWGDPRKREAWEAWYSLHVLGIDPDAFAPPGHQQTRGALVAIREVSTTDPAAKGSSGAFTKDAATSVPPVDPPRSITSPRVDTRAIDPQPHSTSQSSPPTIEQQDLLSSSAADSGVDLFGGLGGEPPPTPVPKTGTWAEKHPDAAEVWEHYREHRRRENPRGVPRSTPPTAWGVVARVEDPEVGPELMRDLITWAFEGRDPYAARHLRCEQDSDRSYLGATLFRAGNVENYRGKVVAWVQRGRPLTSEPDRSFDDDTAALFDGLSDYDPAADR